MSFLVTPQVSINGTSRDALVKQQLEVSRTLSRVIDAMLDAMPHGRDYQMKPEEYPAARAAWVERIAAVQALKTEITAHACVIQYGADPDRQPTSEPAATSDGQ